MAGGVGQVAGGSGEKTQDLGPRLHVRHRQVLWRGGVMEGGGSRGGLAKGNRAVTLGRRFRGSGPWSICKLNQ